MAPMNYCGSCTWARKFNISGKNKIPIFFDKGTIFFQFQAHIYGPRVFLG